MGDVFVRLVNLPSYCVGATVEEDCNGDYNIYVNARYGYNGQQKALKHELDHIEHVDFRNGVPLDLCEYRAKKAARE